MKHYSNHFLVVLIALLFTTCNTPSVVVNDIDSSNDPIEFTILQINDVYEIAPLEGGRVGGLARVAGLLRRLESKNPNTIAVLAGDFLSPTFMNTLKLESGERIGGLQMVEALNAMGLDYATFGNHEFDLKTGELVEKRLAQSDFTYMTSNAFYQEDGEARRFMQGDKEVEDYSIHEIKTADGRSINIAIVGVVLPFNQPDYVSYTDVTLSFGKAAAKAAEEAEVVLGLTHLNIWEDEALAAATTTDIPLFMGGHEHENITRFVSETAITKADANAKTVYVHHFTYYPCAEVTKVVSELVPITEKTPSDPATEAVVTAWDNRIHGMIESMGYDPKQILATVNPPLQGTEAAVRNGQTNYGKLAAKSFEKGWPGAHAYVFNSGSLRLDDNLSGSVTAYDILRSFPYGGSIVKVEMTGEQLLQMLDIGENENRGEGGYLQRFHAELQGDQWMVRGVPVEKAQNYQVVMPAFLAAGREANLGFLGDLKKEQKDKFMIEGKEVKNDIRDLVISYFLNGN